MPSKAATFGPVSWKHAQSSTGRVKRDVFLQKLYKKGCYGDLPVCSGARGCYQAVHGVAEGFLFPKHHGNYRVVTVSVKRISCRIC